MSKQFKLYEEQFLLDVAITAQQLKNTIEGISINTELNIDRLPPSTIDTELLYKLALSYLELHDKALDMALVSKSTKLIGNIH